ncbi:MAG: TauD/TfdA family dioxygenase [Gammaproteobacteria bacterium]|nr:TauD/TfdA family dioxygenase [Gammaproteobacteria bacterium]MDH3857322.1 TauD/TfdA family dioxygenase [Gammaproteobacteria bacterium]
MIGGLGAEISGIALDSPLDDETIDTIKANLWRYQVVVFHDQPLSPQALVSFGRKLGRLKQHPFIGSLEAFPEIMVICKEAEDLHNFAGAWHTDTSYQEVPALASMLLAVEVPEKLGDTLFCNMVAAFEALSDSMRSFIDSLEAVHSFTGRSMAGREQDLGYGSLAKDHQNAVKIVQPVVRTHFESKQKMIYVNPMFTESILGLTDAESAAILSFLYQHCIQPEFIMRLRWRPGTVVIWDNAATMHYPLNDYAGHRRLMHRVVIAGNDHCGRPLD